MHDTLTRHPLIVAGIGTEIGKTVVSAILATALEADYWKPIQCGEPDSVVVTQWLDRQRVHTPAYSLQAPVSPHQAARLENVVIQPEMMLPATKRPLIIEGVGGVLVPLTTRLLAIDVLSQWSGRWIIVSKHYLGSINHTLLTIEALRKRDLPILGLVFNGAPQPDSEAAICEMTGLPILARLLPERTMNKHTIQKYAYEWMHLATLYSDVDSASPHSDCSG